MATAPTTINIRRKSCIIAISVVLIHCHFGKPSIYKCIGLSGQVQVWTKLSVNKDDFSRYFVLFSVNS
ncbi:hypothetical protein EDWATA_01252 [Edwardsiella tarda ATCC 23685]|uniref:Uncharacterized protein n=1 Tax=Edwardsiella tarda ATCC 23685 TaxID=500638 RepID=D4F3E9_EDWTA|nr:hypothetical protein EDWATA_01252 [Edwardsiella tarda ATCC 23685]